MLTGQRPAWYKSWNITRMGQRNSYHSKAKHDIAQLPHLQLANAHEKLRIFRLEQGKVQRSLVDLAHQLLHAGLDDQVDDAANELVDAQQHQDLRWMPLVQRAGVPEDHRQSQQAKAKREQRLEDLRVEIAAIGKLA